MAWTKANMPSEEELEQLDFLTRNVEEPEEANWKNLRYGLQEDAEPVKRQGVDTEQHTADSSSENVPAPNTDTLEAVTNEEQIQEPENTVEAETSTKEKKELDFEGSEFERYSPSNTRYYMLCPDKDLLVQIFDRIPKNEIEVIIEGFTSIQDFVDTKNKEIDFEILLNEQRGFEQARIELMESGISIEYSLSVFEQNSCMKGIERCEERLARGEPIKEKASKTSKEEIKGE